jgi:hypothetical protein
VRPPQGLALGVRACERKVLSLPLSPLVSLCVCARVRGPWPPSVCACLGRVQARAGGEGFVWLLACALARACRSVTMRLAPLRRPPAPVSGPRGPTERSSSTTSRRRARTTRRRRRQLPASSTRSPGRRRAQGAARAAAARARGSCSCYGRRGMRRPPRAPSKAHGHARWSQAVWTRWCSSSPPSAAWRVPKSHEGDQPERSVYLYRAVAYSRERETFGMLSVYVDMLVSASAGVSTL